MTTTLLIVSVGFLLFQFLLVRAFVQAHDPARLAAEPRPAPSDSSAAIILCCRGSDPSLAECLRAIDAQRDSPAICLVVTDSEEDPAVAVVERHLREHSPSRIQRLVATIDNDRRSLKCNSLVQALDRLDSGVETVLLIDADVIPPEDWARQLIAATAKDGVGAAFGTRWFEPPSGSLGSWLRHLWNAAAIVQMHVYHVAWGGSLAIRREPRTEARLADAWSRSLFEDVLIGDLFRRSGWQVVPVPGLFLRNQERCSVRAAWNWINRQLLDARLYHSKWPLMLGHAVLSVLIPLGWLLWAAWACIEGRPVAGVVALGCFVAYQVANGGLLAWIQRSVESSIAGANGVRAVSPDKRRGSAAVWRAIYGLALIPLVQAMNVAAAIRATVRREVTWRGIRYSIRQPLEIQRLNYRPYALDADFREREASID
jgi:hypothetical protein